MFRKKLVVSLAVLALVLAVATHASADCRNKITLNATAAGAGIGAIGTSEVRALRGSERFKAQVEAPVPDGTTFAVFADGQLAGTLTIVLGVGELDLNSNNGPLPTGVSPVCGIKTVEIKDGAGTLILSGNF